MIYVIYFLLNQLTLMTIIYNFYDLLDSFFLELIDSRDLKIYIYIRYNYLFSFIFFAIFFLRIKVN